MTVILESYMEAIYFVIPCFNPMRRTDGIQSKPGCLLDTAGPTYRYLLRKFRDGGNNW